MSLLAIIFIAIVIPFAIIFLGFVWFYIRSRIAKLDATQKPRSARTSTRYQTQFEFVQGEPSGSQAYASEEAKPVLGYKPTYRPLSHFLESTDQVPVFTDSIIDEYEASQELTVIPGISKELEHELRNLGYSSVEQIARWGRADVRAVSADLGIEQQHIEDVWIANARLITAMRSTSITS